MQVGLRDGAGRVTLSEAGHLQTAALDAGADIVNDISGFTFEPDMAQLVAERGAGCIVMHTPARSDRMSGHEGRYDVSGAVAAALAAGNGRRPSIISIRLAYSFSIISEWQWR